MRKTILAFLISLALIQTVNAESDGIYMKTYEVDDGELIVEIKALDMTIPVIGMAFDLYYDPYIIEYESYEEGEFFERGGEPIYMVAEDVDEKGRKIISGVTLRRIDSQVDDMGLIMSFHFKILKRENIMLKFDDAVISSLEEGARVDLTNIEWTNANMNFATEEISEEVAKTQVEDYKQIETGTGSAIENTKSTLYTDVFMPEAIAAGLLPIAIGVCYILWRQRKDTKYSLRNSISRFVYTKLNNKKHEEKTDIGVSEPEKEKSDYRTWTEI
ncbi:MAG: hypothetical protein ACD_51C00157G0003 [uncultured bacterium]|nr:MAG: hypothetical protein ACD_51C00157G0003 [uncultured bacterium]OGJ47649.1 MAG: hypothetical protein A2244_02830 [Candidatus Peregrinibacteria bacterium RIFOXYA2_FULL_41_18]OGJ48958.1 MAG: hypothetical protein A2344_00165 [Candidatus Peregrinibacteria bacterium RIFOXYB12_FULL_41_12]OGJ52624.1 MAG: hypothetical protein A2448_02595 [Candidatus Peregrinibacteria bacterium RIFOXYC2_FULL_41_22]OGJ53615.1 MAG: hypothetical protein A2336_00910 [Candidatus Peregrinibacteria bacterium RIFOXYB2_FULL